MTHSEETYAKIARRKTQAYEQHRDECGECTDETLCVVGAELVEQMVDASIKEFVEKL